jgi:hypothetical protein
MNSLKFAMSRQDADLVGQALDVYATTLMCAPLGLGLDLLVAVRALRDRLEDASTTQDAVREATDHPEGNVLVFARA